MAVTLPPSNGKTLLITGINGYIGSVIGALVLSKGYNLRGTSRSVQSSEPLLNGAYKDYRSRVQIYEVPDITAPGAFDEAVAGVHGIFHVASPVDFSITTYEGMIYPAVHGSETLLKSALKAGPQLESVVVTSSVAAISDMSIAAPGYSFTEKDYARTALNLANKNLEEGKSTPSGVLYVASKTAADKAVWDFRNANKPHFPITTINPGVVIGPPVQPPSTPSKLNETLRPVWTILSGEAKTLPPQIGSGSFVDVRDVATMHLWAFEHAKQADGERYIAVSGYGPTQGVVDILREKYVDRLDVIPVGKPGEGYVGYKDGKVETVGWAPGNYSVSGEKARRVIGIDFIDFKTSVLDTAKVFEAYF